MITGKIKGDKFSIKDVEKMVSLGYQIVAFRNGYYKIQKNGTRSVRNGNK